MFFISVCVCVCSWQTGSLSLFHLIPDQQVNNARLPIWPHTFHKRSIMADICSLFQLFSEIICSCFFIISHWYRKELEFSNSLIWKKRKKSEVTKTSEKSGLKPDRDHSLKNLQSIILGCLRVDKCRSKEIDETISVTATNYLSSTALASVRYAQRRSFRFVLFRVERQWRTS